MKTLLISLRLFGLTLLIFGLGYPLVVLGIAQLLPNGGEADYKKLIGQEFKVKGHFWGRPSATGYNGASTGGSNLSASNPAHIASMTARRDSILKCHPYLEAKDIPVEWITASGSGLDPHISYKMAQLQVKRIANHLHQSESVVQRLVDSLSHQASIGPSGNLNLVELNTALKSLQ